MEITVCKFGGTSLANSENIKKVRAIVHSDPRRRIIIVSAPGKRTKADIKITDTLFKIHELKEKGENYDKSFGDFKKRFEEIKREFRLKTDLDSLMDEFYSELRGQNSDFITSTGEYFSAKLMADVLGFEFIDMDKFPVISFNEDGSVNLERSRKNFQPFRDKCIVIPGFYGLVHDTLALSHSFALSPMGRGNRYRAPAGTVKTFSRGGSDITGAIIANIANAKVYENWTDVDGVYDKDPNKNPDAKKFDFISYDDVEQLARNGANVLHPDCIQYVREKNIPINLKNTFNPSAVGTIIN